MSNNIKIDFSGLDRLAKKVHSMSGTRNVSIQTILTNNFISKHSNFNSLDQFMSECGIHTAEEFKAFPDSEMDKFVKAHTSFNSWQEMISSAGAEYYKKQLGF